MPAGKDKFSKRPFCFAPRINIVILLPERVGWPPCMVAAAGACPRYRMRAISRKDKGRRETRCQFAGRKPPPRFLASASEAMGMMLIRRDAILGGVEWALRRKKKKYYGLRHTRAPELLMGDKNIRSIISFLEIFSRHPLKHIFQCGLNTKFDCVLSPLPQSYPP